MVATERINQIVSEIEEHPMQIQEAPTTMKSGEDIVKILLNKPDLEKNAQKGVEMHQYNTSELQMAINQAVSKSVVSYCHPLIKPSRFIWGGCTHFLRRILRKLLSPIIVPIVEEITSYHMEINHALTKQKEFSEMICQNIAADTVEYQNFKQKLEDDKEQWENWQIQENQQLSKQLIIVKEALSSHETMEQELRKQLITIKEVLSSYEVMEQDLLKQINDIQEGLEKQVVRCDQLDNHIAEFIYHTEQAEYIKFKNAHEAEKKTDHVRTNVSANNPATTLANKTENDVQNVYEHIDYFDFENHFRGSRADIRRRQEKYLQYFKNANNIVLDLGCGRGEFLELMNENQIAAKGVDSYQEYVSFCNSHGLDVMEGDAIEYLRQCSDESVGGIFACQIAEHLSTEQLLTLCCLSYEKLEKGSCIVMETPNPTCLNIYTNSFYIDPSHVKPVHPQTLQYFLEKAGFGSIEVIFTEDSKEAKGITPLMSSQIDHLDQFNKEMKQVSDRMFGSQDYAIVAYK